ncbi:MAG TPA: C4-type zinc ribbon domain-containing protein [Smithella sp.]|nr:C4-type zinc ribbon domain-containing protein [Smithella sp.]HRS96670.1 C4-type zinc ribbon domain-containing protein [Smithella sp.]
MKEKLLLLIRLQECDLELVKLSAKKKVLPEQMQKLDNEFNAYQEEAGKNKIKLDELKAKHRENEQKIKRINEGIVKTKERMLEVKNNKEYQAMLKEIEMAENSKSEVETEIIALLEELDKLAALVREDEEKLGLARSKYEKERKDMEDALNSIDAEVLKLEEKKTEIQNNVPSDLLSRYEKIKKRGNGVAITSVWKAVCNGCHMNIPPQLYNELQRTSELLSCPNCNRIIYFQEIEKTA